MSYPYLPNQDAEGLHHVKPTPEQYSQELSLGNRDGSKPRSTRPAPVVSAYPSSTVHHITPTADQLDQQSSLGNWDGRRPPTPHGARTRSGAPAAAPAPTTHHVVQPTTLPAGVPHVAHGYAQGGYQMNAAAAPVGVHPPSSGGSQTGYYDDGSYMAGGSQKAAGEASSSRNGASSSRARPGSSRRNYTFKEEWQLVILRDFYDTRSKNPSHEERTALSKQTGLQTEVITKWFSNHRRYDPNYVPGTCALLAPKAPHIFTQSERQTLEQYRIDHGPRMPSVNERAKLAAQLGIDTQVIYTWFINSNQRKKKSRLDATPPHCDRVLSTCH